MAGQDYLFLQDPFVTQSTSEDFPERNLLIVYKQVHILLLLLVCNIVEKISGLKKGQQ